MAVRTITTRLALDGETQFKQAMTSINGALRNLKSELMLSEAQFRGQANTIEALTAKDKLLQQTIEQQREKVRALAQALTDANAVYGENSAVSDRYRQQLNRAQTELINLNGALSENARFLQEARDSATGTAKSIDEFGFSTQNAGSSVGALSAALQAAGVAATLKEIADAIHACVDASMEFETAMANFNKVAKLSDSELSIMAEQIKELSTKIPATASEIAQVAEASSRLGIAKEEAMPPYIIFSDKTLIDMCVRLPKDQREMLMVSGVGAHKYSKYGQRFLTEITVFMRENPSAVLSTPAETI